MKSYFFVTRSRVPPQFLPSARGAVVKTEHGVCLRKKRTSYAAHVEAYVREIIHSRSKLTLYFYAIGYDYMPD